MARIPCSFSAQEEFLARVNERAAELGMKRSEYIVHALRRELMGRGQPMSIIAEQAGTGNSITQTNSFSSPSAARAGKAAYQKKPRGKKGGSGNK